MSPRGTCLAVSVFVAAASASSAATINVNSNSALTSALGTVAAGDTIVLADGNYAGFTATRSGTSSAPITIRAANRGKAVITSGIVRYQRTSFVTIEGLTFTTPGGSVTTDGSARNLAIWFDVAKSCRLTRCSLKMNTANTRWVSLSGASDANRVDHNDMGPSTGTSIYYVWPSGNAAIPGFPNPADRSGWANGGSPVNPNIARNTLIDHNYFHDHGGSHEVIVLGGIGMAGDYQATRSTIEFNLFERDDGDNETIAVKSSNNIIRYNTYRNVNGYISLRAGNATHVYGNFLLQGGVDGSGGIRLFENDHVIYNNYISDPIDTPLDLGVGDPYSSATFGHAQVKRALVVHNTFVSTVTSRLLTYIGHLTGRPLKPADCVVANNIFVSPGNVNGTHMEVDGTNLTITNNIVWGSTSGVPGAGFTIADPRLTLVGEVKRPSSSSPAIGAAHPSYFPFVTMDMDGQARSVPDIGADELSSDPLTRRPLLPADVGPNSDLAPTPTPTVTPTPTSTPTPTPTRTPTVPPNDVEVTPGASAVTASTSDANVPGNVVDNSLATRWSAVGDGEWIKLDLGSARTVTRLRIAVYSGNTRQNRFDLQVSTDNAAWTNVLAAASSSGTTTLEEDYDFADAGARWVRYVGHGSSDPTKPTTNSVTEISVFALAGTPTVTPTATSTPTPTSTPSPTPTPTSTPTPTMTPTPTTPPAYVEVTPPGGAVTASTNDGNVPSNTVDNDLATRWSANGDGQWLQLDLGTTRTVGYVKVAVFQGNTRSNRFDLQVSSGGGVWTTVWSGQSSGTTTAEETYEFDDVAARWVRYLGHMNTANGFNSVTEVSVFGVP